MSFTSRLAAAAARGYGLFRVAAASAVDPFFNYVTALLHGDGTNGAQNNTFLDSSTNNFTITRNGNTTQGSFSPFSQTGWSNYFDGSGDYLTSSIGSISSGASFTFEFWAYFTGSLTANVRYFDLNSFAFAAQNLVYRVSGVSTGTGAVQVSMNGSQSASANNVAKTNSWQHHAISYDGTTLSIWVDGTRVISYTPTAGGLLTSIAIGSSAAAAEYFTGYISNFRLVIGSTVYTPSSTTITVPTTPLTAISGTSLLTCQANRFLDASSNAYTITRNGDVSVQPFSPFNPTSAWSASSNGGSGYFDGSGDYLSTTYNSAFDLSTGDFTIDGWFYQTSSTGSQTIIGIYDGSGRQYFIGLNGTLWDTYVYPTASNLLIYGGTAPAINQWNHVALVRDGANFKFFVNGALVSTVASQTLRSTTSPLLIGTYSSGSGVFIGYLSGLRIVKGTALYTAAFTPPTSPPTAVANTSFLANFTNGGIYDNAAVADYETVGNAQISTSVFKYGTGSMYFDGNGDWLYTPSNTQFAFGTGDFTIEFWVYFNAVNALQTIFDFRPDSTASSVTPNLYLNSDGTLRLYVSASDRITSSALSASTWYHVSICRVAGQTKMFINGTQNGSTYSDTNSYVQSGIAIGYNRNNSGSAFYYLNGYIDDLRFTKGIGRYAYNFTPPTAAFPNIGGTVTPTSDQYFNYTTLLLPGNGTNGAQNNTFLDSSSNAFTITRNGNTTQGTFSPFSQTGWGAYFDGSGDYLVTPSNAALSNTLLANDFTIETWLYLTAAPSGGAPIWTNSVSNSDGFSSSYVTSNLAIGTGKVGVNEFVSANNVLALNQWNHFACVRNGSTVYIYVNGTQVASGAATTYLNTSATKPMTFGQSYQSSPAAITGYFSNIRVVSSAVYTANFTPPTAPLTAITNTQLLTCQSNRFVDNSSNAFAITRNGDVSVQAFSPFAPTASYSASTVGGSGYFDGSGDYLAVGGSSNLAFGAGDFTVEGWFYPTTDSGSSTYRALYDSLGASAGTTTAIRIYYYNNTLMFTDYTIARISGGTPFLNGWNHFALSRSGTSTKLFLNGTQVGSTYTDSNNYVNGTSRPTIGGSGYSVGTEMFVGYLGDIRSLKGTALYTANFTPPTAPLTAITNTQLLLSATNAGITDATAKNNLETVGNAQISTTQSKFGGSSMAFDGAGDYLSARMIPDLVFGSGDMTIECWIYANTISGIDTIFDTRTSGSFGNESFLLQLNSGIPQVWAGSYSAASALIAGSSAISTSTWTHIAFTKSSGTNRLFVNGILVTSNTNSWTQTFVSTNPYYVGQTVGVDRPLDAYLDDLRITKGIARYTSNFTPPTSAFLTL